MVEEEPPSNETPSVEEVCEQLDLKDVSIEYDESHYQSLVTYKMFTQFVRPIIQKENPKTPSSKLMMLIAAKWRDFCEENPNLRDEEAEEEAEKSEEEEAPEEQEAEYQPKPSRSRASRNVEKQEEAEEEEYEEEKPKKRSNTRASKKGKKQKVPTLKIRFGKKKEASSEEEKVSFHSIESLKFTNFFPLHLG